MRPAAGGRGAHLFGHFCFFRADSRPRANWSGQEVGLTPQRIAQERLYVSEDHLRRVFSQLTGRRFSVYLEQCRIRLACRLLEYQPDMKISHLAELVGYPLDGQYFSKVFRKVCGVTPTDYRNKLK